MLALEYCREASSQKHISREEVEKQITSWKESYFGGGDITLSKGQGCKECSDSGFRGRVGVYELLKATPEIKKAILKKAPSSELHTLAQDNGMNTIKQDGIRKVLEGVTDFSQVRIL